MKKRVLLNIVCVVLMILSIVGIYLVIDDARHMSVQNTNDVQQRVNSTQNGVNSTHQEENFGSGERPEFPDKMQDGDRPEPPGGMNGEMPPEKPDGDIGQFDPNRDNKNIEVNNRVKLNTIQIILVCICTFVFSSSLLMMVWTKFFSTSLKNVFINTDKYLIFGLELIILVGVISLLIIFFGSKIDIVKDYEINNVSKEKIDETHDGEEINKKNINLNEYNSNIKITESGEYTLSGKLNYSVLIDVDSDVIINLNGVDINSSNSAAIANMGTNKITVNLIDDSINKLSDGGESEYDGCLYSNGPLIIDGKGTLEVNGNQVDGEGIATTDNDITINNGIIKVISNDDGLNAGGDKGGTIKINGGTVYIKASGDGIDSNNNIIINGGLIYAMGSARGGDAGIDADNGIAINGGTIIALGSDMLEKPTSSKQKYIAISLPKNSVVDKDKIVTLLDKDDKVIISFKADENFKTLIISNDKLTSGTYKIYVDGSNTGKLNNSIYKGGKYTKGTLLQEVTIN